MATCLEIVQSVAKRIGINSPTSAVGNTDLQIIQLVELINEEGQELAKRHDWTVLQTEATFTTVATESQGLLETLAPACKFIINDTIWNRTLRRPVFGPQAPQAWQQQKAFAINGPWSSFRIRGGYLRMYPVPTAGQSCYFEYVTKNWATDTTGVTGKSSFSVDTDICLLDEQIVSLGGIWRWKQAKGFEYAEDFNKYERAVMDAMGQDGSKDWLSLTNTKYDIFPGIVVPSGSWNVP